MLSLFVHFETKHIVLLSSLKFLCDSQLKHFVKIILEYSIPYSEAFMTMLILECANP